jgi:hypothetical protein
VKLADELRDYIRAAFTGLWLQTFEPDEAEREVVQLAKQESWRLAIWDVANGLRIPGRPEPTESGAGDAAAALKALPTLSDPNGTAVLVLHNFHRFLNDVEVVQTTAKQLVAGKHQRTFIIVLSPIVQIPTELEKLFVVVDHQLPDREQLLRLARELTIEKPDDLPEGKDLDRVLDALVGLTRYEAEGALALSLARHDSLRPDSIWELKAQTLKKNRLLTLHRGKETFDSLGGLGQLKDFCRRALAGNRGAAKPRGILLLSAPGCGKSQFAKSLGTEMGRPTLLLDIGSLLGSLMGQSEGNLRQALKITDAMSPAILFCDELEKALSGVGSQGDSGVSTRLFGTLLTWLSDHDTDVFFVGTCNDISRLPPEFTRAKRFDAVFFLDLPESKDKDAIWTMYRERFGIPKDQVRPQDTDWTGAEIKSCCRLSALLDVPLTQAAQNVVPVAVTAAESVEKLRSWASGRCLSASNPGIYTRDGSKPARVSRRVQRGGPSLN